VGITEQKRVLRGGKTEDPIKKLKESAAEKKQKEGRILSTNISEDLHNLCVYYVPGDE